MPNVSAPYRYLAPTCMLCLLVAMAPAWAAKPKPEIVVAGLKKSLRKNVRAHLSLSAEPCDAPRWRVQRLFTKAEQEIEEAMRAVGYYKPSIRKALRHHQDCWTARFDIEAGDRVRVTEVDIRIDGEASEDPAFVKLLADFPVKEGSPLNHATYEEGKRAIESLAAELGYFSGELTTKQLRVHPGKGYARVRLRYDSGPRFRFGAIDLRQDVLDPELVERFVVLKEGDPYASATLAAQQQALSDSTYFSGVDVRPRIDQAQDQRVPIDVELTPRKQHSYSFGVGAATDTGPRLSAGYENRRINRYGHRLAVNLKLATVESELSAAYKIPLADPRTEQLSFHGGIKREDTDTAESTIYKLGTSVTAKRSDWLETRFLDLTREESTIADEEVTALLLVPGISWARTSADNRIRPRRGYRVQLEVRGGHQDLLSDTSFVQFLTSAKWIRSQSWGGRLIARGELGLTAVEDFDKLPASYRFFAGGDNSIRGYKYKSLGPENADGEVVGGQHLIVGSIEYEHPVTQNWGIAAFVDAGNAVDDLTRGLETKTGVGLGVRWHSPIGPVRVDLASPLDDPDTTVRLHFSMGAEL